MGFCGCNCPSLEDRVLAVENHLKGGRCDEAAKGLAKVERKKKKVVDPTLKDRIALAYRDLGDLQKQLKRPEEEKESRRLAEEWG